MSVEQAATIRALANLSGSFLLLGLLFGLIAGSAALWVVGRGLGIARREMRAWAPRLLAQTIAVQTRLDDEVDVRIYRPHVRGLSRIEGLKAGVAAFIRGAPPPA
jgi:hypothetical protein